METKGCLGTVLGCQAAEQFSGTYHRRGIRDDENGSEVTFSDDDEKGELEEQKELEPLTKLPKEVLDEKVKTVCSLKLEEQKAEFEPITKLTK